MFRLMTRCRAVAIAIVTGALATSGCSGGGSVAPSVPKPFASVAPPSTVPASSGRVAVTVVISIPQATKSSLARRPAFVSPGIKSATVVVTKDTMSSTATGNVSCTPATPAVCTISVDVLAPAPGTDTFSVTAFDQLDGTGNTLSQGSISYPIAAGAKTTVPVVLTGMAASILSVNITNAAPTTGDAATSTVSVTAADASGNAIVGPYLNTLSLQLFENDPETLFSFTNDGSIVTTPAAFKSSTDTAKVYLNAKTNGDVATPDDATLVASIAGSEYTANGPMPSSTQIGEITTACPASSGLCLYYPTGVMFMAAVASNSSNSFLGLQHFGAYSFPSLANDPARVIYSMYNQGNGVVTAELDDFDIAKSSFQIVASAAPAGNAAFDLGAGSFLTSATYATPPTIDTFTSTATTVTFGMPLPGEAAFSDHADPTGHVYASGTGLDVIDPSTMTNVGCTFEATDPTFGTAAVGYAGVYAQATVTPHDAWIVVDGTANGGYILDVPITFPNASGCDLSVLAAKPGAAYNPGTAAFPAGPGGLPVAAVVADPSSGLIYGATLGQILSIDPTKKSMNTLLDIPGTSLTTPVSLAFDPAGKMLYFLDIGNGTVDRIPAGTPTSDSALPKLQLPAVLMSSQYSSAAPYTGSGAMFLGPDGNVWLTPLKLGGYSGNPSGYTFLGATPGASYCLIKIIPSKSTFASSSRVVSPLDLDRVIRLKRSQARSRPPYGRLR